MKKILKVVVGILGIIVVLGIVFFMVDYNRVKNQKRPIFCIQSPAGVILDGGTIEYLMKVDSTTIKPTSISIIIINNNDNEIGYGEEYKIQKNINGEWKYLDYLPNTAWNDVAYIIKANSQTTKKLNLENTYGELEKGTYRVIKTVFFGNGKKTDIYSTEFEIK